MKTTEVSSKKYSKIQIENYAGKIDEYKANLVFTVLNNIESDGVQTNIQVTPFTNTEMHNLMAMIGIGANGLIKSLQENKPGFLPTFWKLVLLKNIILPKKTN